MLYNYYGSEKVSTEMLESAKRPFWVCTDFLRKFSWIRIQKWTNVVQRSLNPATSRKQRKKHRVLIKLIVQIITAFIDLTSRVIQTMILADKNCLYFVQFDWPSATDFSRHLLFLEFWDQTKLSLQGLFWTLKAFIEFLWVQLLKGHCHGAIWHLEGVFGSTEFQN